MPLVSLVNRSAIWSSPDPKVGRESPRSPAGLGIIVTVLEQLFVCLLLLSSMNVITSLTPSSGKHAAIKAAAAEVDTFSVTIEAGVYTLGGFLALLRWRRVLRAARTVWPLLALVALACLSTAWSIQPMVTLRRSAAMLVPTLIAIYIGERYSIEAFARLLARTMCLMMMLVLLLYIVAPGYVVDDTFGGAWRGLSTYKNTFGEYMAVAVLLLVLVRFHRISWARYVFVFIAAGLLLLSRSATALVCGVLGLAAIPLWRLVRSKQRIVGYFLLALLFSLTIYCALELPDPLFQILGRDATLTGRTRLWDILLPVIANRPMLGYGYGAFWNGLNTEVLSVWIAAGRLAPVADNGYIDLWLSLGAVGVGLFLYIFVQAFHRAIEYLRLEPEFIGVWPITYLCIFAADNISESALFTRGTFSFLVFAILATSLALHHKRLVTAALAVESQPFMLEESPSVISG